MEGQKELASDHSRDLLSRIGICRTQCCRFLHNLKIINEYKYMEKADLGITLSSSISRGVLYNFTNDKLSQDGIDVRLGALLIIVTDRSNAIFPSSPNIKSVVCLCASNFVF